MDTSDATIYRRLREAVGELLHVAELHGDTRKRPPCCDLARRRDAAWAAMRAAYDAATTVPADDAPGGGIESEGDGKTDPFAP